MNAPQKETGGLPAALTILQLPTVYRCSVFQQVFSGRRAAARRCVACDSRVTNRNLGGSSRRSALSGELWCLACADYPEQLLLALP